MRALYPFLAAVVIGLAPAAYAQVAPSQNGQALDANYQVGSGGYNTVNGGLGGVNSQLYINGQVTGLGAFHGSVPYSAVDTFRGNQPYGAFNTFQQQSVGMPDALNSSVYRASPYVSPYNSVPAMPNLIRGELPTMIPRRQFDSNLKSVYANAMADYQALMANPPAGLAVSATTGLIAPVRAAPGVSTVADYSAAAEVTFGAPRSLRNRLVKELRQSDQALNARVNAGIDTRVDAQIDAWSGNPRQGVTPNWQKDITEQRPSGAEGAAPSVKGPPETANPSNTSKDRPSLNVDSDKASSAKRTSGYEREGLLYPKANQDVFVDLLVNLQARRNMMVPPAEANPPRVRAPRETGNPSGPNAAGAKPSEPGTYLVDINEDRTVVLHGLAGVGSDMFNKEMVKAQGKLRAGKFYDAAGDFETACIIDLSNPLPRVGEGLATFAAGEPFNAAVQFRQAMTMFPPIMETRMDIAALMDVKAFNAQLAYLDRRVGQGEEKNEIALVFLAAFLHYSAQDDATAKAYAKQLKDLAGDDKLMTSYAEFLLTGKRPMSQKPATAPTRK